MTEKFPKKVSQKGQVRFVRDPLQFLISANQELKGSLTDLTYVTFLTYVFEESLVVFM